MDGLTHGRFDVWTVIHNLVLSKVVDEVLLVECR